MISKLTIYKLNTIKALGKRELRESYLAGKGYKNGPQQFSKILNFTF